jgi:hypothetical protein
MSAAFVPFSMQFFWNGSNPFTVTVASGQTNEPIYTNDVFRCIISDGSGDFTITFTVLANGSGHLDITTNHTAALDRGVTWTGMNPGDSYVITVRCDVTDNATAVTQSITRSVTVQW